MDTYNYLIEKAVERCKVFTYNKAIHPEYINDVAATHALEYLSDAYGIPVTYYDLDGLKTAITEAPELVNDDHLIMILMAYMVYRYE